MPTDALRILVIRFSSMGDIILTTPVLAALKARYPLAELDFVIKEEYSQLLEDHPHIHRLYTLAPGEGLLSLRRRIRERRYGIIVDLHANLRSRWLTALLRASTKVRYHKGILRRRAMVMRRRRSGELVHVVDRYLRCLRPLGIAAVRDRPRLFISPQDKRFGDEFVGRQEFEASGPLVGLHPGAKWPAKRWPGERFAQVAHRLAVERGARVLVFGGPGEELMVRDIAREIGPSAIPVERLSVRQLMAVVSRCDLFITNDSGPMHLATALEVPVAAIFGPTHPALGFWPLGDDDIVLTADLDCSPCTLHGKKKCSRDWSCLEAIGVEDVLRAALKTLDRNEEKTTG
ncbi:glycosyltransferase family 9 protein [Candidatus Zixiibacteriota bacterium]